MKKRCLVPMFYFLIGAALIAGCSLQNSGTAASSETRKSEFGESGTVADSAGTYSKADIENKLNLANNEAQEWSYDSEADAWILSAVTAVLNPEIADEQGVSVAVPGSYVKGIDTDKDGKEDIKSSNYIQAVKGRLVIDYETEIKNENNQTYTADTAPAIFTTGAAGYSEQQNQSAGTSYAKYGYISIACGNRGKQSSITDDSGNTVYTGDAPLCLVDQKNAVRFVKYNMLLGNLPGSIDCFVSTGGSGGGAHAAMYAAASNNPDFYDYQIESGAVGVYKDENGVYSTTVNIDGNETKLSDGVWGSIAYSAITPLYEADMAQAFEYYIDTTYKFNTGFQKQLAQYLSKAYMEYINNKKLSVEENKIGFDINNDGDVNDNIVLTIEYDPEKHPETNGYYGTYLNLYLAEFESNLQWYLDNIDYAQGWTWFDSEGQALSSSEAAALNSGDKARAFLEGRYAKSSQGRGGFGGEQAALGNPSDKAEAVPSGNNAKLESSQSGDGAGDMFGENIRSGGPSSGSTSSADSSKDSSNYETFEAMVSEYSSDIAEIKAGDKYGRNIVNLYNPLNYIGNAKSEKPKWVRMVMGAVEGDIPMMASLNLKIAWFNAGVDTRLEWQWDGSHVPSEIFGNSLPLYVDTMYGKYVNNTEIVKAASEALTENGTQASASGTDISSWVEAQDLSKVSFTLPAALSYRNSGASKAVPGFDVIDYGQEDYEFGSSQKDARHWNVFLDEIFKNEEYAKVLSELFNTGTEIK